MTHYAELTTKGLKIINHLTINDELTTENSYMVVANCVQGYLAVYDTEALCE